MQKYMQILKVICFFSPAEKCECKELALTSSKLFCTMNYAYGECVNTSYPVSTQDLVQI